MIFHRLCIYFPLIAPIYTDIPCFRAHLCSSVGHNFPLIAPIYTDIPCFRAHPCPSVGHNFPLIALIYTDPPCFRAHPCPSVGGYIPIKTPPDISSPWRRIRFGHSLPRLVPSALARQTLCPTPPRTRGSSSR